MVKPHDRLVLLGSTRYRAYTCNLSTGYSIRNLQETFVSGISHLEEGFPLRCFQRLSLPNVATRHFTIGMITGTPEVRPSRSSRTKDRPSQISNARSR